MGKLVKKLWEWEVYSILQYNSLQTQKIKITITYIFF